MSVKNGPYSHPDQEFYFIMSIVSIPQKQVGEMKQNTQNKHSIYTNSPQTFLQHHKTYTLYEPRTYCQYQHLSAKIHRYNTKIGLSSDYMKKYLSTSKHNTANHTFIQQTTYANTHTCWGVVCKNMTHIPNPLKSYFIMSIACIPKYKCGGRW